MPDGQSASAEPSSALFTILGTCRANGGLPRYYIQVGDEVRFYRGWEVGSVAFLIDLLNDHEHWRRMYPRFGGYRIDVRRSREAFIAMFEEAGPYDPPEHLQPRGVGRPVGAKDSYRRERRVTPKNDV